ncbi:Protein transport protein Sec24-like CEF [Vitis vinifera]|uniref:Protein transport protein Sec24-like CEF n=1 Tax=Vitis vinifera TaxID=29760 RepID=A0A438IDA4_VITVI|nr:Protein transport protein Sec24-like CEF [Vitis vinifera]
MPAVFFFLIDVSMNAIQTGATAAACSAITQVITDLPKVLQDTIFMSQGAFVEGRQILDVVLIANELVYEKRRSREEGLVFKIDFEKAYDHVDWGFLDHVLERKGFSSRWRSWIRGCLSSTTFVVLVNGNAKGWVELRYIKA